MKVILSFGLGVDSATILFRWLMDPASRDFDLKDLVVVTSMVGNEFPDSKDLVERHLLPLMAKHDVRYVQIGRTGPSTKSWTVLSDSRTTAKLFIEGGGFTLGDELLNNGTVPQVGGTRKCSLKFKGDVLDPWIEQEMAGESFRHVMGFNADEARRVEKDKSFSRQDRHSEYPLVEWGWGRDKCEQYLEDLVGEPWAKSCCVFCPFANNRKGLPAHVERLRRFPEAAAYGMLMERVAEALNPRQSLFVGKNDFQAVCEKNGLSKAQERLEALLDEAGWAIYRVRRVFSSVSTAQRSLDTVASGSLDEMERRLATIGAELGKPVVEAKRTKAVWVSQKGSSFPCVEEHYVLAPHVAQDKQSKTFEAKWEKTRLPVLAA